MGEKQAEQHAMDWSFDPDDAYAPSVFAEKDERWGYSLGIRAGGRVVVMRPELWIELAAPTEAPTTHNPPPTY